VRVVYGRADQVLHRNTGPDVVAMLPGEGDVHLLSGPAAVVWELLSEEAALDGLIHAMADLYDRPAEEIAASVETCLNDLASRRLVEMHRA